MIQTEGFVRERVAVYTLTSFSVSLNDVTSLDHESRNNAMERSPLIMQWLSMFAHSLLTGAEKTEVVNCLRCDFSEPTTRVQVLFVQSHGDASCWLSIDLDIEIHL